MHHRSALHRYTDHHHRRGRNQCNHQPNKGGEGKAHERDDFQDERVPRLQLPNRAESERKKCGRGGRDQDQSNIDGAVDTLASVAAAALREVGFVIYSHLGRKPTDVIAPARKDVADHTICALCAHVGKGMRPIYATQAREVAWLDYSVIAGSGSVCDANKSCRSRSNSRCWMPRAFSAAMRAISG